MKQTVVILVLLGAAIRGDSGGEYALELPLGLPAAAVYLSPDNPLSAEKIALGRQLFFDPRLSGDYSLSCASCHIPQLDFADGRVLPIGIGGQQGRRHVPTIINRAFSKEQFWDGRSGDLEEQAKDPIANPIEMGASYQEVVERLRAVKGYRAQFERVYGTRDFTIDHIAQVIAAFERTLVSGHSAFDRFAAGDTTALSPAARRGLRLFRDEKTNCFRCHVGDRIAYFGPLRVRLFAV